MQSSKECKVPGHLSEQYKEIEEKNKVEKASDLFKKIGDIKGTFHARMGTVKGQEIYGPNRRRD